MQRVAIRGLWWRSAVLLLFMGLTAGTAWAQNFASPNGLSSPAPTGGFCSSDVTPCDLATAVLDATDDDSELLAPATVSPGDYVNTSDLLVGGVVVSTATATLTVEPLLPFTKSFTPDFVGVGLSSTLTFTIDNTDDEVAVSSLDFTDNLPADLVVATPSGATTDCTGGTLTAAAGSSVIIPYPESTTRCHNPHSPRSRHAAHFQVDAQLP